MVRVGDVVIYDDSEWTVEEFWSAHGMDLVTIRDNSDPSWNQDVRTDEISWQEGR